MRNSFEFLIPIVFFAAVAIVIYYVVKFRNSERMAIIEKGLSEQQLSYFMTAKKSFLSHETTLKLSALLIGVGLAILIGNFVPRDMQETTIAGLVFIFPGIGLLLVYRHLTQKMSVEEKS